MSRYRSTHSSIAPFRMLFMLLMATSHPAWAIDISVDILGDPVPDGCTPGSCSLREAVTLANSLAGPDRILLPATPGVPLQLSIPGDNENANATGDLDVLDDLEIIGTGVNTTLLVQTAQDRVIQTVMARGKRLTLRGLTVQGGNTVSGGAVSSGSLLTIEDAAFVGNRASYEGGAIQHSGFYDPAIGEFRLVLRRVRFENNVATRPTDYAAGGALHATSTMDNSPYLLIEDCEFSGNEGKEGGGAIYLSGSINWYGGVVTVRRSNFSANRSGGYGGAAMLVSSSSFAMQIEDSIFDANVTTGSNTFAAGAIHLDRVRSAVLLRTTLSSNSGNRGGAMRSNDPVQVIDSYLFDNTATLGGGALWARSDLTVDQSTFKSNRVTSTNSADSGGGAIGFSGANLDVFRSTFSSNDAFRGGAISLLSTTRIRLFNNTVVASTFGLAGRQGTVMRILDDESAHSLVFSNNIFMGNCTYPSAERKPNVARGNIESPGSTCRFDLANSSSQNQLSATSAQINLGALGDNGGPTPTRLPGAASIAINQGSEQFCLATDQRHYSRNDAFCDVGSVEVGAIDDTIFQSGFDSP